MRANARLLVLPDSVVEMFSNYFWPFVISCMVNWTSVILTANGTAFLVGAVAAAVAAAANDRVRSAPAVVAPKRTVLRRDSGPMAANLPAARASWLVATVPTGHHRVAELVRRQALPVVASERTPRTLCAAKFPCLHLKHLDISKLSTLRFNVSGGGQVS